MTPSATVHIFSPPAEARLQEHVRSSRTPRDALLPVLWLAQEEFGSLTPPVLAYVAERLGLDPAPVRDAASFYSMFRLHEGIGRYWIQVCATLPCAIAGCGRLLDALRQELRIDVGETTPDGLFTLQTVECLADCDRGPVLMANDRFHRNLDPAAVPRLIADLRAQAPRP